MREQLGQEYSKLNQEALDLITFINKNNLDESLIPQDVIDMGFVLVDRDPEHPLLEGETEYGIKHILRDLQTNKNYSITVARSFFNHVREAIGMNANEVFEDVSSTEDNGDEILGESSEEENLNDLINQLGAHIEFSDPLPSYQLNDDIRADLNRFGIEFNESTVNSAMIELVSQIGNELVNPELGEDWRTYYLKTLLPEIAKIYRFQS